MVDDQIFFEWLAETGQIRLGCRAIIPDPARDLFLVEKNSLAQGGYLNFIGGSMKFGETLDECLRREIQEETNAAVKRMEYLFLVENFIVYQGDLTHGVGHYFLVELDREDVQPRIAGYEFIWLPRSELARADLRPHVVRDSLAAGTFQDITRLVSRTTIP